MSDIWERLEKIMADSLKKPGMHWEKTEELSALGINSLQFIKLIVALEEEFDIEFEEDDLEMEKLNTLEELAAYIEQKM